jgi:hypothetical protein
VRFNPCVCRRVDSTKSQSFETIRTVHRQRTGGSRFGCSQNQIPRDIRREQRRKLVKGEFVKSSGPSIGKDVWRASNISLTHCGRKSKGGVCETHET